MPSAKGWRTDIFSNPQGVVGSNETNELLARHRLIRFLLARWSIFHEFIKAAKKHYGRDSLSKISDIKRQWLLFQVLPLVRVDEKDPFVLLSNRCFFGVDPDVLETLEYEFNLKKVLEDYYDPSRDKLFFVLDEAQVAGVQHLSCFADATGTVRRPVLDQIVKFLTEARYSASLIVSGTGFSLDNFKNAVVSSTAKVSWDSQWSIEYNTGDFMDQATQKAYLQQFLPPTYLLCPSGIALVKRLFEWLRGRYVAE
jgi:hypothetical protein